MTLTKRLTKGKRLTYAEADANWEHCLESSNQSFIQSGSGAGAARSVQTELREIFFNVKSGPFGATGDGSTDDTTAIANAISAATANGGGVVYLPKGTYKITSALSVTDKITLMGAGSTTSVISTSANTFNAIELTSDARRVHLSGFGITSSGGVGASNAGIKMNLTLGPAQSVFEDLRILRFFKGIEYGDRFWDSTVRNVRCDECTTGAFSSGTAGTNINVVWDRFYSEEHTAVGFQVASAFTFLLHACNFGGELGGGQSQAVRITSNSQLRLVACNFEAHLVAADAGVVSVESSAQAVFDDCTWAGNSGAAANGYELKLTNTASVHVRNSKTIDQGSNMSEVYMSETAKLYKYDDGLADVNHASGTGAGTIVYSPYQARQFHSEQIDLSGAAVDRLIYVPKRGGRVTRVAVIYAEASSADAGIEITVKSDDDNFTYATFTSHTSQAVWDVQEATLNQTMITSARPIIVSSPGGKTGTGEIIIVLECSED